MQCEHRCSLVALGERGGSRFSWSSREDIHPFRGCSAVFAAMLLKSARRATIEDRAEAHRVFLIFKSSVKSVCRTQESGPDRLRADAQERCRSFLPPCAFGISRAACLRKTSAFAASSSAPSTFLSDRHQKTNYWQQTTQRWSMSRCYWPVEIADR